MVVGPLVTVVRFNGTPSTSYFVLRRLFLGTDGEDSQTFE